MLTQKLFFIRTSLCHRGWLISTGKVKIYGPSLPFVSSSQLPDILPASCGGVFLCKKINTIICVYFNLSSIVYNFFSFCLPISRMRNSNIFISGPTLNFGST
jgi:hypothetical protein